MLPPVPTAYRSIRSRLVRQAARLPGDRAAWLLLAAVAASACAGSGANVAPEPTPRIIYVTPAPTATPAVATPATRMNGHVTVYALCTNACEENPAFRSQLACESHDYPDIRSGTALTVRNEAGEIVGVGQLVESEPGLPRTFPNAPAGVFVVPCEYYFTVSPIGYAQFYSISLGRRDGPVYSCQDLVDLDFTPRLTLGP